MKVRLAGLLVLCCVLALFVSFSGADKGQSQTNKGPAGPNLSEAERDLLTEINQARANPQVYATYLEKLKPLFKGKSYTPAGDVSLTTQEGWSAVEDAIKFVRAAKPAAPLSTSDGLRLAAIALSKDQSGTGTTGHKGTDSTLIEQRVKPFGTWQGGIGENLAYGNESARERVLTWLIDDGFPSRGHRTRMMSPNYKVAGLSCGPHPEFQIMCVLTLAGGFVELVKTTTTTQANSNTNSKKATTTTQANSNTNSNKSKPPTKQSTKP
jgi:uncharacterized protein YkwD